MSVVQQGREETMTTHVYHTIGSVAELLGIPRWKLAYLIERGTVPGASLHVPGRRLFTDADVEAIRRALLCRVALDSAQA